MLALTLIREISVGDVLTSVTILLSVVTLWNSLRKDREGRTKAYADGVRAAGATTVAALDRFRALALGYFEDIQPCITDADRMIVETQNATATRDAFWRALVEKRSVISRRIDDEKLELSYASLYKYGSHLRLSFLGALNSMKSVDRKGYQSILELTQRDLYSFYDADAEIQSAELGNRLRRTVGSVAETCRVEMESAFAPYRKQIVALIDDSDRSLFARRVPLEPPASS